MDVLKVLAGLRLYKGQLDEAITSLDRLARERGEKQRGEKRGPPPKAPAAAAETVMGKRRKRKPVRSE